MDYKIDLNGIFRDEVLELLEEIDLSLVRLADDQNNSELINTIFRALHSIKGTGSMFGLSEIADFVHAFESVFDRIRKGSSVINRSILDLSFQAGDAVRNLILNEDTSEAKETRKTILRDLETITNGKPVQSAENYFSAGNIPQGNTDTALYKIICTPKEDIFRHGIDILPVLEELASLGTYRTRMNTDKIPALDDLDCERCYVSFSILLDTSEEESRIKDCFVFIAEYIDLSIQKIDGHIPGPEPEYEQIEDILVPDTSLQNEMTDKGKSEQIHAGEIKTDIDHTLNDETDNAITGQTNVTDTKNEQQKKSESATIRVSHEKLDKLVDLVGEFVTMQARLFGEATIRHQTEILSIVEGMGRLTGELRDIVMKTRTVPVNNTFNEFHRLVFHLSHTLGKEIRLKISGGETEIDKNAIEALKDPLMHIIRNACDHGIEYPEKRISAGKPGYGTVELHAEHAGGHIVIKVIDDGAGLNPGLIRKKAVACGLIPEGETDEQTIFNTIFEPGFSTATRTTGVSGRGVGMDVVKKNVEKLRGSVMLESAQGTGTRVIISIPLTLAIIEGLLTRTGDQFCIINLSDICECVDLIHDMTAGTGGNNLINLRGETIPYIRLRDEFGINGNAAETETVVIVEAEGKKTGLVVDQVTGQCQSVIKPLSAAIRRTPGVTCTSILGDGSIALIIDVREIVRDKNAFVRSGKTNKESSKQ